MVDLKGKLKLVFPTFYMARIKPVRAIREYHFPNDVQIQAGIEPSYKMDYKDLETSPRIVGDTITVKKDGKATYRIITVDLGDTVIKKGQWYGVWVALENLDGVKMAPFSRTVGSQKSQIFELSTTNHKKSFIEDDYIRNAKKIRKIPTRIGYIKGFSPAAILAKTNSKVDTWAIVGSSSPEGWYDIRGDQYGDENGNVGYADKLLSTVMGCPSVSLAKGSDSFTYAAEEYKGRLDILTVCNVNKVHVYLTSNDLNGGRTFEMIMKNSKKLNDLIAARNPGIKIYGTTVLPRSTSSDKFETVENQKAKKNTAGANSLRGKWNAMMRTNPQKVGYFDAFELSSYVEHDWKNETGVWSSLDATPSKYTADGVHPTCAGSTAIAENAYLIIRKKK